MAAKNVEPIAAKKVLTSIRHNLEDHVGKRVMIRADKGRRKVSENEGVLEGIFPNIFVVKVNACGGPRRLTYTYSEVLTRQVRIKFKGDNQEFDVRRLAKSA